ncbi:Outer membrane receptor for ferrienterochelin and colicins [Saccharicrinis carchari]|uniref:Outer membrane receptor for ferrienterochelin and colicins n=1 Tax=Saccharicrinis carchari TaxID=1168039 RepID=A0A521DME4_SACCC|nr:TonB-dependent receptor [Saccharicrinis carchari]SMO72894.1 Outer membrane receptor for ferrienterochelin and colicins [Saccharicrinis carchari]
MQNYKLNLYIIISLLTFSTALLSQNPVLKGVVKDAYSNVPLQFVNMVVYNTTNGTTTDSTGQFSLEISNREFVRLQLSFIGYKSLVTEEIMISNIRSNYIEILMEPTSETLSEITVKSSPFAQKMQSPVSLRRIGIDQIERSAGANRDISKVIQSFPGVGSTVSFRNDIIVRGGGPAENKFYIDGIEIPTINHFSTQGASGGPVGILNVDFIREVDFYSSAFPAARGNALSSVLEFKQKDGSNDQSDFKAVLGASEIAFSASGPLSKKTTAFASVRRSYLQFLFKALDLPFLPTFNDFQFKTKTRINAKNEISFLGFGAIDNFELNNKASDTQDNQYILSYLPVNNQWNYTLGTNYKHFFGKSYLTLIASRSHLNNEAIKYRNNVERGENLTYNYQSQEIENKFRAELDTKTGNLRFNTGISLEAAYYSNSTYRLDFINGAPNEINYHSELNFIKYGAFGSAGLPLFNDRLNLSLGLRVDASSYSDNMRNPFNQISPRFSASLQLAPQFFFNFNVGRYYQLPSFTTMGYRNTQGALVNKQNDLKYIYADHTVVGLELRPNNYSKITLEGFFKDYSDYPISLKDSISLASKGGDFGVVGDEAVQSTGSGRAYGFEVMARQRSPKGLSFIAAYTFVRSEFSNLLGEYVPSSWDSKHLLTATINKTLKNNWDIGLKWRFLGGLPYTPVDENTTTLVQAWDATGKEYLDYDRFNSQRLENFHQLDVRIDKRYLFNSWSLEVYLDIQNLYNYKIKEPVKYVQKLDTNGSPIIANPNSDANQQRYEFDRIYTENGTLLPTLGVIVEF